MTKGVCPLNLSLTILLECQQHLVRAFTAPDQASSDVQRFATLCRASIAEYTTPSAVTIYFITPPSGARGGLKENGQNPDSGSKNSENQNNDAVS